MGQVLGHKETELTEARAVDTVQGEIKMMEEQLEGLKSRYEGWISTVAWTAFPEQHQVTEGNIKAGLQVLGLVYIELQRLLMAREENPSQWEAPETALTGKLVKALEDDYTELKGSQYLL